MGDDGIFGNMSLMGTIVLLVMLGLGIKWYFGRLTTGSFGGLGGSDVEMEGSMRTKIDHGDL